MVYGMYLSAGGAISQSERADVIANNVANASTPGFRPQAATFRQYLAEELTPRSELASALGGGSGVYGTGTIDRPGRLVQTGRSLDMAIHGQGYFAVEREGRITYTRDGSFTLSGDGEIVTSDGLGRLLGASGPISVPGTDVIISEEGSITGRTVDGGTEEYGTVALWGFRANDLERAGGGFVPRQGAVPTAADGRVRQGSIEQSAVEPVREMSELVEALRVFEANMQFVRIQDSALQRAVNDIARLPG